jgi:hypothetical protein
VNCIFRVKSRLAQFPELSAQLCCLLTFHSGSGRRNFSTFNVSSRAERSRDLERASSTLLDLADFSWLLTGLGTLPCLAI